MAIPYQRLLVAGRGSLFAGCWVTGLLGYSVTWLLGLCVTGSLGYWVSGLLGY
jgi:hypothetical protein